MFWLSKERLENKIAFLSLQVFCSFGRNTEIHVRALMHYDDRCVNRKPVSIR